MKRVLIIIAIVSSYCNAGAQVSDTMKLTLAEAIHIARTNSPGVLAARHSFRTAYWEYCSYRADYLPTLSFTSTPSFQRMIDPVTQPDGTLKYVNTNRLVTDANLNVTQAIPWTGGEISLTSGIERLAQLGSNSATSFSSSPIYIRYSQNNLFGYNHYKWAKRINPIEFEQAKRDYVKTLEEVSLNTAAYYFSLALAETNLRIATINHASADTLYNFGIGRYGIGTINESEMLQLEVTLLSEETNKLNSITELENNMEELRIYLGITDAVVLQTKVEEDIPLKRILPEKAVALGIENSPDMLYMDLRLLNSQRNVAYTRAQSGFAASVFAEVGLSQRGDRFREAFRDLEGRQVVRFGVNIPILDWGKSKGRIQVAKSQLALTEIQVEQERINFEFGISKLVHEFNLQEDMINVAARTDIAASRRNDVTMRLYMLDRATILELNTAITEKDAAKRNYINRLYNYWRLYYTLRSLTLYDFVKEMPLTEDYKELIK